MGVVSEAGLINQKGALMSLGGLNVSTATRVSLTNAVITGHHDDRDPAAPMPQTREHVLLAKMVKVPAWDGDGREDVIVGNINAEHPDTKPSNGYDKLGAYGKINDATGERSPDGRKYKVLVASL